MSQRATNLSVGFLMILGLLALGYLSVTFGQVTVFGEQYYPVTAVFSNVAGLQANTAVRMVGIKVGYVESIRLKNYEAEVTLMVRRSVDLPEDTIASIQTEGLLGQRYVTLKPGGLPGNIPKDGSGRIIETNPPLILENLLGEMVFGGAQNGSGN